MALTYFKRYRMEIDLYGQSLPVLRMPQGYRLVAWDESLLDAHADAKFRSFCYEIDANVFPCLGERDGCQRLMREITRREEFVPQATWLIQYQPHPDQLPDNCGTIQGIRDRAGLGAIQNLGVVPEHRSRQLGTFLLCKALLGFREVGLQRAFLEVTAQNLGAVRLYQRLGFRTVKTVYKAAEVAYA